MSVTGGENEDEKNDELEKGEGNKQFEPHTDFQNVSEAQKEKYGDSIQPLFKGSAQRTLDSFRAVNIFESDVERIDSQLKENGFPGVEAAYTYGSNLYGLSVLGDSILGEEGHDNFKTSDIDGIILLDEGDLEDHEDYPFIEFARDVKDEVISAEDNHGELERQYWIHTNNGFKNKLRNALDDWDDGKRSEFFVIPEDKRHPDLDDEYNPPEFGRTMWSGFYIPDEVHDSELENLMERARESATDEEGFLRRSEDFQDDDVEEVREYFEEKFSKEPGKLGALKRNEELGKKYRNLKEHGYDPDKYVDDARVEMDLLIEILGTQISDEELQKYCPGDLRDIDLQEIETETLEEWNGLEPEEDPNVLARKVKNTLSEHPDIDFKPNRRDNYWLGDVALDERFEASNTYDTETYLMRNLAKNRIKQKYNSIDDIDQYTDKELYEIRLEELSEIEDQIDGTFSEGQREITDY